MAVERRSGHFGGKGTSSAELEIIGAAATAGGWSEYEVWGCAFMPFADCTITINDVDEVSVAANVALEFSKDEKIKSLEIAEADIVYQLACYVNGLHTS